METTDRSDLSIEEIIEQMGSETDRAEAAYRRMPVGAGKTDAFKAFILEAGRELAVMLRLRNEREVSE